jgi:hypothetical protein
MCRIKTSYLITVAGHGCGIPSLRSGLLSATPGSENDPERNYRGPGWSALLARPLLAAHHRPVGALRWGVRRPLRVRLRAAGRIQTVPGRLDPRERTVEPRCGFGWAVPAC